MLLAIKDYLATKRTANLKELSLHFKKQPDTMRNMLQHWIRKGYLERIPAPTKCGTRCQICDPAIAEVYQWVCRDSY